MHINYVKLLLKKKKKACKAERCTSSKLSPTYRGIGLSFWQFIKYQTKSIPKHLNLKSYSTNAMLFFSSCNNNHNDNYSGHYNISNWIRMKVWYKTMFVLSVFFGLQFPLNPRQRVSSECTAAVFFGSSLPSCFKPPKFIINIDKYENTLRRWILSL